MFDFANDYIRDINEQLRNMIMNDKYKFLLDEKGKIREYEGSTREEELHFIEINDNGEITGFVKFWKDYRYHTFSIEWMASFVDNNTVFLRHVLQYVNKVFLNDEDLYMLTFGACEANPVNKTYQKMVRKYAAKYDYFIQMNTNYMYFRTFDGGLYDLNFYQVLKPEYVQKREKEGKDLKCSVSI